MTWESLRQAMPGTARVPDDGGKRSRHHCTATEQNLDTGMLRVQLATVESSINWRAASPFPLTREIPVDDFTPDEPSAGPATALKLTYQWFGVRRKIRDVRESPTRLDDIPDGVTVTFRPEGGDVQVGVGLGPERVLTPVADGEGVDVDVPAGPVAVWLVSKKE